MPRKLVSNLKRSLKQIRCLNVSLEQQYEGPIAISQTDERKIPPTIDESDEEDSSRDESDEKGGSGVEDDEDTSGIVVDGDEVIHKNLVSQDPDHVSTDSASSQHVSSSTDDVVPVQNYSPKQDVIQQHCLLISYDHQHTSNDEVEVLPERQEHEGSVTEMQANKSENDNSQMQLPEKKPSRFKSFISYLGRKLGLSKKTKYCRHLNE